MPNAARLLCPSPFASDRGALIGRHPSNLTPADFLEAGAPLLPVMMAIRARCLECCGGEPAEVRRCTAIRCPLWPMRMGGYPAKLRAAANGSRR